MSFSIGQRWISHADLELGLGICVEVDPRRITLLYPSAEEERTYAIDRAPLTRYELKIGDPLTHINGRLLEVTAVDYNCRHIELRDCRALIGRNVYGS
jgi:ATP-dependent helicase HepA